MYFAQKEQHWNQCRFHQLSYSVPIALCRTISQILSSYGFIWMMYWIAILIFSLIFHCYLSFNLDLPVVSISLHRHICNYFWLILNSVWMRLLNPLNYKILRHYPLRIELYFLFGIKSLNCIHGKSQEYQLIRQLLLYNILAFLFFSEELIQRMPNISVDKHVWLHSLSIF